MFRDWGNWSDRQTTRAGLEKRAAAGEMAVDLYFLVGAVMGSGLFIFAGREPARRLLAEIRTKFNKR